MFASVVNQVTKRITEREIRLMMAAWCVQMFQHVSPRWELYPIAVDYVGTDVQNVRPATIPCLVQDHPPPVDADAGAYHTEINGIPAINIFAGPYLDNGGTVLGVKDHPEQPSVAQAGAHEFLETMGDASVNRWRRGVPRAEGHMYAEELCDACQGGSYFVTVADGDKAIDVAVSNFLYPSFFDLQATGGPWDQMGQCPGAFQTAPGGYQSIWDGTRANAPVQVMNAVAPWLAALKSGPAGRHAKRVERHRRAA